MNNDILTPGNVQAVYWNSPLTRKEAQSVFDEYGKILTQLIDTTTKMDLVLSYFAEKLNAKPEEIKAWSEAKMKEAIETQAAEREAAVAKADELAEKLSEPVAENQPASSPIVAP